MEEKSNDLFKDNKNLLKINFGSSSNSEYKKIKLLWIFEFLKTFILLFLFILLNYGLKNKKIILN